MTRRFLDHRWRSHGAMEKVQTGTQGVAAIKVVMKEGAQWVARAYGKCPDRQKATVVHGVHRVRVL